MVVDDLARDGQSQPVPRARGNLRPAIERLEQPRQIGSRHARPAIIDAHAQLVADRGQREAYPAAARRMYQCIAQEIVEHAMQHFRVAADDAIVPTNVEFHLTAGLRGFGRRIGDDVGEQVGDIHTLVVARHHPRLEAREREQFAEQAVHAHRFVLQAPETLLKLVRLLARQANDGVQSCQRRA